MTGRKRNLLLRAGRRFPLLFLSDQRPANPEQPDAFSMWLRKHLKGRRFGQLVADWPSRRVAFPLLAGPADQWLMLDLRVGPSLVDSLPDNFGVEPIWPEPSEFSHILAHSEVWAEYPQYSPPLRKTLAAFDPLDAQALLVDLEVTPDPSDAADVFVYSKDGTPEQALVWPLDADQRGEWTEQTVKGAVQAATVLGEAQLFAELARAEQGEADAPLHAALKKARKTLKKLDQEQQRLEKMVAMQTDAMALQGALWSLDGEAKLPNVSVPDYAIGGDERDIALDPKLTVRENMERFFKQARRGKRGLEMLVLRRDAIATDIARLEQGEVAPPPKQRNVSPTVEKRLVRMSAGDKLIHKFRSSDGFLMLRGRNAKGNHEILSRASAHDYWFHAEDGPSAHLVLRLDYPGQEVPEQTMREAAILVGLKSWQREDSQARVMCALVKEVRKITGAPHGKVRVSNVECSLVVPLDNDVEEQLRSGI